MSVSTYRFYTAADQETLIAAYHAGQSISAIAQTMGRTQNSIENRLRTLKAERRVQPRSAGRPKKPNADNGITRADRAWLAYWRQPRELRRQQKLRHALAEGP